MSLLSAENLNDVVAACRLSVDQSAAAWQRVFGEACQFQVVQSGPLQVGQLPSQLESSGLAMVLTVGQQAMLLLAPQSGELLPPWCQAPDDAQTKALVELARELGRLWLPPTATVEDARVAYLPNLAEAVLRAELATAAVHIQLQFASPAGRQGELFVLWPANLPQAALDTSLAFPADASTRLTGSSARPRPATKSLNASALPTFTKSLLHISVPVTVTLAAQKLPLCRIVELGPGSLLQFEKSCEELLELEVNGRRVAVGEAVKVGDKFGLRVSSMILPDERFLPIGQR